ncbi:hypothetical protein F5Y04DRAFT_284809 [Hypomontagnella monticulosa]|nr:hypothetical protein F5Y04DRAFT_284809 [Hypomontagnella monticulosa]
MASVNSLTINGPDDPNSVVIKGDWAFVRQTAGFLRESDQVFMKFSADKFVGTIPIHLCDGRHESTLKGGEDHHIGKRSYNKACGNCGIPGHLARDCIKVGESGWMDFACPKCNQSGHIYDQCRFRQKNEDLDYLFWYRQNKGPVKSCYNIGELLNRAIIENGDTIRKLQRYKGVPYSPKFARQIQRDYGWNGWEYRFPGRPDKEAVTRRVEPQFHGLTIGQLAKALDRPGWRRAENNVDHTKDGPTPTLQLSLTKRNYVTSREDCGGVDYRPVNMPRSSNELGRSMNGLRGKDHKAESISLPPGSARPIPMAPRKREHEATDRDVKRQKLPSQKLWCTNCGETNHSKGDCIKPCGACGERGHQMDACGKKRDACLCVAYPQHVRAKCTQPCQYCPYLSIAKSVFSEKNEKPAQHLSLDCPAICHYCLGTDHTTRFCQRFMGHHGQLEERITCPQCPRQVHFASDCIANICPVFSCKDPFHCKAHCRECGYEGVEDDILTGAGLPKHTCQWVKRWCVEIIKGRLVRRVYLTCLKDSSHDKMKAKDLLSLRAQSVAYEVGSEDVNMEPWVECRDCYKKLSLIQEKNKGPQ